MLAGMPSIGKSVLALHYAHKHTSDYPGGLFWIDARQENGEAYDLTIQIVELAIIQGVKVPESITDTVKQLRYCARHWPLAPQRVLLVLDNINTEQELEACLKWLPTERFALLITARPQLGLLQVKRVDLGPLLADVAFEIF